MRDAPWWTPAIVVLGLGSAACSGSDVEQRMGAPRDLGATFGAVAREVFRAEARVEGAGEGTITLTRAGDESPFSRTSQMAPEFVLPLFLRAPTATPDAPSRTDHPRFDRLEAGATTDEGMTLQYRNGVTLLVREEGAHGCVWIEPGAIAHASSVGTSYWTVGPEQGLEEWIDVAPGIATRERRITSWWVPEHRFRRVEATGGAHVVNGQDRVVAYVSAPVAFLASGERLSPELRVEGDRLALYVDARGERVLVDPVWVPTGSMMFPRRLSEGPNIAISLPSGVLFPTGAGPSRIAEIYDPTTAVWLSAGTMRGSRYGHTATLLTDGRVLVAGGGVSSAEIFDPATTTWAAAASMSAIRRHHSATLLTDGRVLVVGGWIGSGSTAGSSAEIYDPVANTWATTASIPGARAWHRAVRLADGRVFVSGGASGGAVVGSTYRYDPAAGTWASSGSLLTSRARHTTNLLPDGRVLIVGGVVGSSVATANVEIFNPTTGSRTATAPISVTRDYHTATNLSDGSILVVAGTSMGLTIGSTERYDPGSATWSPGPPLNTARYDHVAALLGGSRVVVAGGTSGGASFDSAEVIVEDSCGDGMLDPGETCDDGNRANDDCCSALCRIEPTATVCRRASSSCDLPETCDGAATCPMDRVALVGTSCRAAVGDCDVPEFCDGTSPSCPSDAARPEGTTCGPAISGSCDVTDSCEGTTGAISRCVARYITAGVTCRVAGGDCDVAEACPGTSASCPPDGFEPSTTICRTSAGVCDSAERCSGTSGTCPSDTPSPDGTTCTNGLACDGPESCLSGVCLAGLPPACDDGNACTADACAEPGGCTHSPILGCCTRDAECMDTDLDPCTRVRCDVGRRACAIEVVSCADEDDCTADLCLADGSCEHGEVPGCRDPDAAGRDGGTGPDGGQVDAATPIDVGEATDASGAVDTGSVDAARVAAPDGGLGPPPAAGCSCTAHVPAQHPLEIVISLVGLALARRRLNGSQLRTLRRR